MQRTSAVLIATAALAALLAGCGDDQAQSPPPSPTSAPAGGFTAKAGGTLAPFTPGAKAVGYIPGLAPAQASGEATMTASATGVVTDLSVTGLLPNRQYGAHAHVKPCGAKGDDAGPHFQFKADPVTPSVDPAYANPRNEIWLDFGTDASGKATVKSTVDWQLTDRRPGSIVIHETHTHTEVGKAGTAGGRVACLTLTS
ncbi:superoxide dismutase family protein [Herbihabitans rhizosphaerae]|nr:superoxide dismutase family protein [Herbihabitans rhizosphaerae]